MRPWKGFCGRSCYWRTEEVTYPAMNVTGYKTKRRTCGPPFVLWL